LRLRERVGQKPGGRSGTSGPQVTFSHRARTFFLSCRRTPGPHANASGAAPKGSKQSAKPGRPAFLLARNLLG
jgi:hypothetical protein